jgi:protein SCO1
MKMRIARILSLLALLAAALFGTLTLTRHQPPAGIAASSVGGPFELIDQDGVKVTDTTMKGKPFLVFFGFTHCPDICPTTLFEISQIFEVMGTDAEKISALFVTVDPARDTPEQLKLYMESFNSRIRGLSGDQAAINTMIQRYKAYAKRVDQEQGSYTMDHTAVVYIMDKSGQFAAPLNLKRPPDQIARDLRGYL